MSVPAANLSDGDGQRLSQHGASCRMPARYLFAILASICFAIAFGANVVLSVAIVAMVNHTAIHGGDHPHLYDAGFEVTNRNSGVHDCPIPPGHHEDKDGPFAWDDVIQGHIRGAYYYGYVVAQLPGAILAEKHGAKWVLWGANLVNVAGLLLTPVVTLRAHFGVFIFVRILMGLAGAMTFPAMHVMITKWVPVGERGMLGGFIYGGTSLGTIGATLIGGYVAAAAGWEWVFYGVGLASLPWLLLWAWLVGEHPAAARHISQSERIFLLAELGPCRPHARHPFPYKAVFTSCPFWAILVTHVCNNTGFYMYLTELPSFMQQVLHKNLKENAGISTIPYVLMWLLSISLGYVLDSLRRRNVITTGAMRKIATGIASVIPCGCMIGINFIGCNALAGSVLMIVAITACGGMFIGFLANHIDIAPTFAGRLMGFTNTAGTIPGIVMPILIGMLTEGQETLARWSVAFSITAVLYAVMFIVFTFFGTAEVQPWNTPGGERTEQLLDPEYDSSNYFNSLDPHVVIRNQEVAA